MTGQGKGTSGKGSWEPSQRSAPLPTCLWVPSLACSVRGCVCEKGTCVYGGSCPCVCGGEGWAESSSTKTGVSGSEVFLRKCPRTSGSEMTISARWEGLGMGKCRGLADALVRRSTVTPPHPRPSISCCSSTWLFSASSRAQTCETLPAYRIRDFSGVPLHFPALTWTALRETVWALWRKFQRRIMPL